MMSVPTPAAPANAFDEGADQSAERQKAALTELLAQQGQTGANLLKNRGEDAAALAAQAKAQYGDAGAPVSNLYSTFERDAQQRVNAHTEEMARIQAANGAYMDQVKGAIPLQRQDSQNYMDAMKAEFEDRQRQREAEQAARDQAAANARSAASNSSALQRLLDDREAQNVVGKLDWDKLVPMDRTPNEASQFGAAGSERNIMDAAAAIGVDPAAMKSRFIDKAPSQFSEQDQALADSMRQMLSDAKSQNVPWRSVVAQAQAIAGEVGLDYRANIQPWLATVSQLWGVQDKDWLTPVKSGQAANYGSATAPGMPSGGGAIYD